MNTLKDGYPIPEFEKFWEYIYELLSTHDSTNPYKPITNSKKFNEILEQLDQELTNIIKAVERGDSLLPDDCE